MGIAEDFDYGNDCTKCFPAGKTPRQVKIAFAWIGHGQGWRPWMPEANNGIYLATQVDFCKWWYVGPVIFASWTANGGGTVIGLSDGGLVIHFAFTSIFNCLTSGANQIVDGPDVIFVGGHARVVYQS